MGRNQDKNSAKDTATKANLFGLSVQSLLAVTVAIGAIILGAVLGLKLNKNPREGAPSKTAEHAEGTGQFTNIISAGPVNFETKKAWGAQLATEIDQQIKILRNKMSVVKGQFEQYGQYGSDNYSVKYSGYEDMIIKLAASKKACFEEPEGVFKTFTLTTAKKDLLETLERSELQLNREASLPPQARMPKAPDMGIKTLNTNIGNLTLLVTIAVHGPAQINSMERSMQNQPQAAAQR